MTRWPVTIFLPMKKLSLFLWVLISALACAQNYQISYNLSYKEDSLSPNLSKRAFVLFVDKDYTKFVPEKLVKMVEKTLDQNTRMFISTPLRQTVIHKRSNDKYTNYEVFGTSYFKIEDQSPMKWVIEPETKEENGYHLQKATMHFGGRKWMVWFIPDIPVNEGPYKFHGLPGLIYEVQDAGGNFSYNLTSIKKLDRPFDTSKILETMFGSVPISITEKKYHQLLLDDYNNPYAQYRGMKAGSWAIVTADEREINTIEKLDKYSDEYRADIRKRNNPIELDKAIRFSEKNSD